MTEDPIREGAERAQAALDAYTEEDYDCYAGEEPAIRISHMLCDLMHLCDQLADHLGGQKLFDQTLGRARLCYQEDITGDLEDEDYDDEEDDDDMESSS